MLWEGQRGNVGRGNVFEESDRGGHGVGVDDLRSCQGMGAAYVNRL